MYACSVTQSGPTLCGPMDCNQPASSVHGISQTRILEWIAISFSSRSSQPFFTSLLHWRADSLPVSHLRSPIFLYCSVTKSCPTHLQHARPPCPSPTPIVYSNSYPLSQWCHLSISSSFTPFSSCLQAFPASGSFPMSRLFAEGVQVLEFQLPHQSFQWIFRINFL